MRKCPVCMQIFGEENIYCPFDGARLAIHQEDPHINITLEHKYRINYKIAEGGMGNVYHATHVQLDLPVAIKILHQDLVTDFTSIERFRREAQAAMKLRHNNAIIMLDFGVAENNVVYLVMEFLEGQSLRELLKARHHLSIEESLIIMQQVCAAVAVAHKRNIIHRDLKPDNIFLHQDPDGGKTVKVLDFGIAKFKTQIDDRHLTRQGMVVGTPHYMSPEQCYGQELDGRSDIYSLGVILYEMLAGLPPFDAPSAIALAMKQATEDPIPIYQHQSDIPKHVNAVVMHALAKRPDDRPATVAEFAKELNEACNEKNAAYYALRSPIDIKQIDEELLNDIATLPTEVLSTNPLPDDLSQKTQLTNQLLSPNDPIRLKYKTNESGKKGIKTAKPAIDNISALFSPNVSGTQSSLDAEKPPDLFSKGNDLWLPTTSRQTYPVICEKCHEEVGRSLVDNSTIICPSCRTSMRRNRNR